MNYKFAQRYGAVTFDPDNPNEALAERARKAVLSAYKAAMTPEDRNAPRQAEYLIGGLIVGVVQVLQASTNGERDTVDAAIRASITQVAGWAVDTARAMQDIDPLPEA